MIAFWKFVKGYLVICVTGFSPERFMNLCSNKGILLWNIHKEQDAYYMCLSIGGFYKLRPVVKKTGTKVAIVKRCGLPFFMSKIRKRKIFLLGFVMAFIFWLFTSTYIWEIDITGNFTITEDMIGDYLNDNDIYVGMKKSKLNIESLKKGLRKEFDIITWTSVSLNGTKLTIEIKENEKLFFENNKTDIKTEELSCDLVAQRDGKIVSMIVREGVPKVAIGDEIKKGDILVSGSVPIYQEDGTIRKYIYCNADADIMLEYDLNISEGLSLFYEKKKYTGRQKKEYYLNLYGKNIELLGKSNPFLSYDTVSKENRLKILKDYYFPVKFGSYTYREYYTSEEKYTDDEANKILEDKYKKILSTLTEKGVQIIEKNVKIETNDSKWILKGVLRVCENAGTSQ